MVIKILDITTRCVTNDDGDKVFQKIKPILDKNEKLNLSFCKVGGVTSSFVNSAFVQLLDFFPFDFVKTHLSFSETIPQNNQTILKCFEIETNKLNAA